MKIGPMIADPIGGRTVALSMGREVPRHIHLDHVAAGFAISTARYNEAVEPWDAILSEAYLESLRENEAEDRQILCGLVMTHAKAAIERPMMLRYQRLSRDANVQDDRTECVQLLTQSGLLVVANVRRPQHPNAAESFEICTAYYPVRIISVKPEQRFRELARKVLRSYAVAVACVAPSSNSRDMSPPQAEQRFLVHGRRNADCWVTQVEFHSLENWGFSMRDGRWTFVGAIPAWHEPEEPLTTSIEPYSKSTENAPQREQEQ